MLLPELMSSTMGPLIFKPRYFNGNYLVRDKSSRPQTRLMLECSMQPVASDKLAFFSHCWLDLSLWNYQMGLAHYEAFF